MTDKRNYLKDEKDTSYDFGSDIPENVNLSDIFQELTRRLSQKYDIARGVFLIKSQKNGRFSAISTWDNGACRSNLSINISMQPSLIEKVAEHGVTFSDCYSGEFSGNFFERKLLLDDDTQSYVLQPIKYSGRVVGMLGYSSSIMTAFSTFEEGALDKLSDKLGEIIWKKDPVDRF